MFCFIFESSHINMAHKNIGMTQAGFVVLVLSLWTNVAIIHVALRLGC